MGQVAFTLNEVIVVMTSVVSVTVVIVTNVVTTKFFGKRLDKLEERQDEQIQMKSSLSSAHKRIDSIETTQKEYNHVVTEKLDKIIEGQADHVANFHT